MLGQSVMRITERYAKHKPDHLRDAAWGILRKSAPNVRQLTKTTNDKKS